MSEAKLYSLQLLKTATLEGKEILFDCIFFKSLYLFKYAKSECCTWLVEWKITAWVQTLPTLHLTRSFKLGFYSLQKKAIECMRRKKVALTCNSLPTGFESVACILDSKINLTAWPPHHKGILWHSGNNEVKRSSGVINHWEWAGCGREALTWASTLTTML